MVKTPRIQVSRREVNDTLRKKSFLRLYQFKLKELGDGICTLQVPVQDFLERPVKVICGPALMAAADAAMWFAVMTRTGSQALLVTSELNTTFLNPAPLKDFRCHARVVKMGRRTIFGIAECADLKGKTLFTHHTVTYCRLS